MKKRDVKLNTDTHREAFNQFADAFRNIQSREHWRDSEIMRHWLDAGFRAIRGRLMIGKPFEENEAEYMRIVKKCQKPKETMHDLSVMLGCAAMALDKEPIDFIGPVFEALVASSELGQFFTPSTLSRMMAEMTIGSADDLKAMIGDKGYISLNEPACGVGGMILAANQVLRERGVDVPRQSHWVAVDVDFTAMCGAYIQCALTDASAVIIHGNSLSLQEWVTTATPAALLYPKKQQMTPVGSPPVAPETNASEPAVSTPEPATDKRGQFSFTF